MFATEVPMHYLSKQDFIDDETEKARQLLEGAGLPAAMQVDLAEPPEGFIKTAQQRAQKMGLLGSNNDPQYPYIFVPGGVQLRKVITAIKQAPIHWINFGHMQDVTSPLWVAAADLEEYLNTDVTVAHRRTLEARPQQDPAERCIAVSMMFAWSALRYGQGFPPGAVLAITPSTSVMQIDDKLYCVKAL